jgi:DNA-binding response OmpR family regulator
MARERILLVEDEADLRRLLTAVLTSAGYTLDIAGTAAQAQTRLAATRYDLVIADWRLPDGDGLEIADHAADLGAKTLVVSGYLFQIPADKRTRHEFLMKPIRPSELIAAVARCIGDGVS